MKLSRTLLSVALLASATPASAHFNHDQTVCYSRAMNGWLRIGETERHKISRLARDGKVKIIEAQTLTCIDLSTRALAPVVLREQWYRWLNQRERIPPTHP